jgi:hypothetical protein
MNSRGASSGSLRRPAAFSFRSASIAASNPSSSRFVRQVKVSKNFGANCRRLL